MECIAKQFISGVNREYGKQDKNVYLSKGMAYQVLEIGFLAGKFVVF